MTKWLLTVLSLGRYCCWSDPFSFLWKASHTVPHISSWKWWIYSFFAGQEKMVWTWFRNCWSSLSRPIWGCAFFLKWYVFKLCITWVFKSEWTFWFLAFPFLPWIQSVVEVLKYLCNGLERSSEYTVWLDSVAFSHLESSSSAVLPGKSTGCFCVVFWDEFYSGKNVFTSIHLTIIYIYFKNLFIISLFPHNLVANAPIFLQLTCAVGFRFTACTPSLTTSVRISDPERRMSSSGRVLSSANCDSRCWEMLSWAPLLRSGKPIMPLHVNWSNSVLGMTGIRIFVNLINIATKCSQSYQVCQLCFPE